MATVARIQERRRTDRLIPEVTRWQAQAVLRPGQAVVLVNISSQGALVESPARLRPGAQTELQLIGKAARRSVRGRLDRCHIASLVPLCYRGAIVFERAFDLDDAPGSE